MNPRSLFLFPTPYKLVYKLRATLVEDLGHDVTFSSAVNTVLAYGLAAIARAEGLDRDMLNALLREIDIFAADTDLGARTGVIERETRDAVVHLFPER